MTFDPSRILSEATSDREAVVRAFIVGLLVAVAVGKRAGTPLNADAILEYASEIEAGERDK